MIHKSLVRYPHLARRGASNRLDRRQDKSPIASVVGIIKQVEPAVPWPSGSHPLWSDCLAGTASSREGIAGRLKSGPRPVDSTMGCNSRRFTKARKRPDAHIPSERCSLF
jgi:hypothetical protein